MPTLGPIIFGTKGNGDNVIIWQKEGVIRIELK